MHPVYVRKNGDKPRRQFRFLTTLTRVVSDFLPRSALITKRPPKGSLSKVVRLRPEVADVLEVLIERYEANNGVRLTTAEVIAAALVEAVPRLTAKEFHQ